MNSVNIRKMVYSALFTALICVCSFIRINLILTPVPVTLQVYAVFVTGLALEPKWSFMSVLIYIMLGVFGLPVFAGMTAGAGILAGPTGGFIVGFLAGVFVISTLSRHMDSNFKSKAVYHIARAGVILAGMAVIYAFGIFQFMLVTRASFITALNAAILPFVFADCLKLILAVVTVGYIDRNNKLFKRLHMI